MIVIGITGGIGSGKSAATEYITDRGYTVLDADKTAHEIMSPGGKAIPYLKKYFGDKVVDEHENVNRDVLRKIVYSDTEKLKLLEKGTTEIVMKDIEAMLESYNKEGKKVVFIDVPLLFEKGDYRQYDSNWLVHTDMNIRIRRIIERDRLSETDIKKIIAKQMPEEEKMKLADEVIDNSGTLDNLYKQINLLLTTYNI